MAAWFRAVTIALVPALGLPATARPQPVHDAVRFLTVDQGPGEFRSDEALAGSLAGFVEPPLRLAYNQVVEDVVTDHPEGGTFARLTPYAFVVAEMLGARLDLVATYSSRSTGTTTYNAYFVIRRDWVPGLAGAEPSPEDVLKAIRDPGRTGQPARFIYHDQLSTSSYFVPSLYLRKHRVFAQNGVSDPAVSTIAVARHEPKSSSELVAAVARGEADFAAVWDGTIAPFRTGGERQEIGRKLWFVKLPSDLPCDLLVATAKVDDGLKQQIRDRIAHRAREARERAAAAGQTGGSANAPAATGDVDYWVPWADPLAERARTALSFLRQEALAPPAPVIVDVNTTAKSPVSRAELEAVRQAIRLAGTEFVPKREYFDYYKQHEARWVLSRIHDGAVHLEVAYDHFELAGGVVAQEFDISYVGLGDLTRSVAALIHARMHRIRQVWLYNDRVPTIIRDVDFEVPAHARLPLKVIEWSDPERNDFKVQDTSDIMLADADFFSFRFEAAPFPRRGDNTLDFEPMGRTAYRVLLMRQDKERALFKALAVALVALFVLAAAGLCWDVRRTSRRRRGLVVSWDAGGRVRDAATEAETGTHAPRADVPIGQG